MSIPERSILQLTGSEGTAEFDVDPNSEYFQMTVGKEKRIFKKVDLWAMIFTISDPDQQEKMMPVRQREVDTYKRIHKVKVTKHLKPGDIIRVHCEMNVEKTVTEGLKGLVDKKSMSVAGGIPIFK
jgi:hypothetical protein